LCKSFSKRQKISFKVSIAVCKEYIIYKMKASHGKFLIKIPRICLRKLNIVYFTKLPSFQSELYSQPSYFVCFVLFVSKTGNVFFSKTTETLFLKHPKTFYIVKKQQRLLLYTIKPSCRVRIEAKLIVSAERADKSLILQDQARRKHQQNKRSAVLCVQNRLSLAKVKRARFLRVMSLCSQAHAL